jgi:phosphate starvation-inducible PhoH-like protein
LEATIRVPSGPVRLAVLGSGERNLKILREALGVAVSARAGTVTIRGERDEVFIARKVIERLAHADEDSPVPARQDVMEMISEEAARLRAGLRHGLDEHSPDEPTSARAWDGRLDVRASGRLIRPATPNQQIYIDAIRDHDLVFAIGPAGTGKTYLAVAAAVHLLKTDRVRKVILCRPAVEAGEKLGFLPGDLEAKVNPYLRPLFDALHDMLDYATLRRFMDSDVVEIVPLAFMRGRTLNNAVIILDEAQNTTRSQMKMFLTRMGHGSKMIVTGDATQIDLEQPTESGLLDAARRLAKTNGIAFVGLDRTDVVRHTLVQRVIDAYEASEAREKLARENRAHAGSSRRRRSAPDDAPAPDDSAPDSDDAAPAAGNGTA